MYAPQYAPPPGYVPFNYQTPPLSPSPGGHGYYSPRYSMNTSTSSPRASASPKGHTRHSSHQDANGYYASPRHYAPAGYASPGYFTSPQRNTDYVSSSDRTRSSKTRFWVPVDGGVGGIRVGTSSGQKRRSWSSKQYQQEQQRYPTRPQHIYNVVVDDDGYLHERQYESPPPPYDQYQRYQRYREADSCYYDQVPIYTEAEPASDKHASATPHRSRARRASHAARPSPSHNLPRDKPRPTATATKSPPKATEEDARRAGIPAGYSYKNWDPTEEPIILLGSVFDANSLGKWIYDWTVFHHGPATPMSEIAGDLWLLLIQLAGKMKRAEESMPKIRKQENREMVDEFLESGERLWMRFSKLLKLCEEYMWKAARKEAGGEAKGVKMGKNAGCEFVDSIFGRDRELERTEKLMTGMRLWSMRFDANCEDILRNPSA